MFIYLTKSDIKELKKVEKLFNKMKREGKLAEEACSYYDGDYIKSIPYPPCIEPKNTLKIAPVIYNRNGPDPIFYIDDDGFSYETFPLSQIKSKLNSKEGIVLHDGTTLHFKTEGIKAEAIL